MCTFSFLYSFSPGSNAVIFSRFNVYKLGLARKRPSSLIINASLPACCLYEKRGYKTLQHERLTVENGVVLVYEIMEKCL